MKQINMFGDDRAENVGEEMYTKKIKSPVYEPKDVKPHELALFDSTKTNRLINEIENANLSDYEKKFLIEAAHRHTVFNYERIAEYYAHSSKEIQELMERSALIIIDFEKAIQLGYVRLSEEIKKEYLTEYGE